MVQQSVQHHMPAGVIQPKRRDVFFHAIKTGKLITALIKDRRVPLVRKVLFFGSIIGLLVILLFPDVFGDAVLGVVMPFVGNVLGIPLDAGFDWVAFALVIISLLRIFPAEIVAEHYQRLFHRG